MSETQVCDECQNEIKGATRNCKDCNAVLHGTMCGNDTTTGVLCGACFLKSKETCGSPEEILKVSLLDFLNIE